MTNFPTLAGIDASGQIIGEQIYSSSTGSYAYLFIYDGSTFTNFTGPNISAASALISVINDNGAIVGSFGAPFMSRIHGLLDIDGTFTTIDDPDAAVSNSMTVTIANGINNAGQIVGSFVGSVGENGFLDTNGTFSTITDPLASTTPPGGGTYATGINNNGQIVGYYTDATGIIFGFIDNSGTFTIISDPSAGGPHAQTIPAGINDAGAIVGDYVNAVGDHGFVDNDGCTRPSKIPMAGIRRPFRASMRPG